MKKLILTALFSLFYFCNFAQNETDKINPQVKTFKIYPKSAIKVTYYDSAAFDYEKVAGTGMVFEYYYQAAERSGVSDDEFVEKIIFQANPRGKTFDYTDKNIGQCNLVYFKGCYCPDGGNNLVKKGHIKGKKINSTSWDVSIDISFYPRKSLGGAEMFNKKIKGVFKIAANKS